METPTCPIQIGIDVHHTYTNKKGKEVRYLYSYKLLKDNHPEEWDGWVNILEALPFPFDLVHLATEELKVMPGWWSGFRFEAVRLRKEDTVKAWKYRGDHP